MTTMEESDSLLTSMKLQHQQEQTERLIVVNGPCKVVEYLQPLMSKELLCKFPDNSAFDFDYTQSSIWSPLAPRGFAPMDLEFDFDFVTPKKLAFDKMELECSNQSRSSIRKVKKSSCVGGFGLKLSSALRNKKAKSNKNSKKKKRMGLVPGLSPTPVKGGDCYPIASKVWNKVLKAASKHFKKKKKDPMAHVRFTNYIKDGNI